MICFCSAILDGFRFADILSRVFMSMLNSEIGLSCPFLLLSLSSFDILVVFIE